MNPEVQFFYSTDESVDQLHTAGLQSDGVFVHAGQQRLKSLNFLLLSLLCDALQNTFMTETHTWHTHKRESESQNVPVNLHLKHIWTVR